MSPLAPPRRAWDQRRPAPGDRPNGWRNAAGCRCSAPISRSVVAGLLAVILGLLPLVAGATTADDDAATVKADQAAVNAIGKRVDQNQVPSADIQPLIDRVTGYQSAATDCISAREAEKSHIAKQIETLGSAVDDESALEKSTRADLKQRKDETERLLADCRLLAVTSDEVLSGLQGMQNRELANRLLARGPPTWQVVRQLLSGPPSPADLFDGQRLLQHLGMHGRPALLWLGALMLIGLVGGLSWRRRLAQVAPIDPSLDLSRAVIQSIGLSLNRYRPGLLISGLWSLYWLIIGRHSDGWPLLAILSFVLFGYYLALAGIRASFNPPPPALPYLPFAQPLARRFSRALHWLALNALVGAILFAAPVTEASAHPLTVLLRSFWGTLLVLNLVWTIGLIRRLRGKKSIGLVRLAVTVALLSGLGAEWAGYRHLSVFIIGGVVQTVIALLLAWLVSTLGSDLLDSLDQGRHDWERRLRARLGVGEGEPIPGLFWLRILIQILIWAALIFALLRIWGLPSSAQSSLLGWTTQGFSIGNISIQPLRVIFALMLLAILLSLSSWARTRLDLRLARTRMEHGAREAAVAITGYGLMISAALIALSVAGVTFQNLAIIAGALSVGIGFGLQNIVNNFVSGLILLFERPIRTGDWIVVGGVEGHVRRISIRSTQIETFDHADVIVPNSDLISGNVTNWMLRDNYGRVRVPVGVAYGSDTQKVKEILLRVAREHPLVVSNSRIVSDPYVLFLAFGDSSLNFELRAHVRHVDRRLTVLSDLNFAIDAAFREAGVEIPFPQRDLHIIRPKPSAQERPGAA